LEFDTLLIDTITIDTRFNGPPQSANGGWAGGMLARHLRPASLGTGNDVANVADLAAALFASDAAFPTVSVSLRAPPPLGVPLDIHRNTDNSLSLKQGELELAHAQLDHFELSIPKIPSLVQAKAASALGYQHGLNRASWPYSNCFACGVSREDGLCITPSPMLNADDEKTIAACWTPSAWLTELDGQVKPEAVWAALDCPAGIAWSYQLPDGAQYAWRSKYRNCQG
jgi:hypothetical protein